jgi:hypothetical protein
MTRPSPVIPAKPFLRLPPGSRGHERRSELLWFPDTAVRRSGMTTE